MARLGEDFNREELDNLISLNAGNSTDSGREYYENLNLRRDGSGDRFDVLNEAEKVEFVDSTLATAGPAGIKPSPSNAEPPDSDKNSSAAEDMTDV